MRRVLLWAGSVLVALILGVMLAGWWFLSSDLPDEPALPGERVAGVLEVDGLSRSWGAYLPADLEPGAPVVFVLHGSRGSGEEMRAVTAYGFDLLAEREGVVAVYPDGFERHWNDCRASASYSANTRNVDDVTFLRSLVAVLGERYGVDPAAVYMVGLSNGGHMAYRMALEAPEVVAGVAAFAANLPVEDNLDCRPSGQPVPVLVVNGSEDPINPHEGGLVELLGDSSRGEVLSSRDTVTYWAGLSGYPSDGQHSDWQDRVPEDGTSISVLQWMGPGRAPVALVTINGGGHTMPDPVFRLPRLLGLTSREADSARLAWHFFSEGSVQQRPGTGAP